MKGTDQVSEMGSRRSGEFHLGFVDTHFHLWDPTHPALRYEQLEAEYDNGPLGDRLDRLKGTRYLIEDYMKDMQEAGLRKAVHVQAAIGTTDPAAETAWVQSIADKHGLPQGILAYVDLRASDVESQLERHCVHANMRGVRILPASRDLLDDPRFRRGYRALEQFGLVCGMACKWPDMRTARGLAEQTPGIPLVLDHAGLPMNGDDDYFDKWSTAVADLARCETVWCKISGLALCNPAWTISSLRRWISHCIESFGPDRVVFGSNWPVDKFTPFTSLLKAYVEITSQYGLEEQTKMLATNAEELYRL